MNGSVLGQHPSEMIPASSIRLENAGAPLARLDFPVRTAKIFLYVFFALLALLLLVPIRNVLTTPGFATDPSARLVLSFCSVLLLLVAIGLLVGLTIVGRRPRSLTVHEKALVLNSRSGIRVIPWSQIVALKQVIRGRTPNHAIVFDDGRLLIFGLGSRAQEIARHIAQAANLSWTNEPFFATRPPR
jgi:hypothetical protein